VQKKSEKRVIDNIHIYAYICILFARVHAVKIDEYFTFVFFVYVCCL
jgi:hypothetical protein